MLLYNDPQDILCIGELSLLEVDGADYSDDLTAYYWGEPSESQVFDSDGRPDAFTHWAYFHPPRLAVQRGR